MDKETRQRQHKPFLFNIHNFDDPNIVSDAPPPPPVYTEADLANAREAAFEQGRLAGQAAEQATREAFVASLTQTIGHSFTTLFEAERQRATAFEAETILVTRTIFARLFPGLNEMHGLAEVERVIATVLDTHRQQPEIIVEVNSEFLPDAAALADAVLAKMHNPGKVMVKANDSLWRGDCRMLWHDGGAERNATALAASIQRYLEEALAGKPSLQDNRAGNDTLSDSSGSA